VSEGQRCGVILVEGERVVVVGRVERKQIGGSHILAHGDGCGKVRVEHARKTRICEMALMVQGKSAYPPVKDVMEHEYASTAGAHVQRDDFECDPTTSSLRRRRYRYRVTGSGIVGRKRLDQSKRVSERHTPFHAQA